MKFVDEVGVVKQSASHLESHEAVVEHQPSEVLASLSAEAFVGARYGVGAVVCRSKYGECGHNDSFLWFIFPKGTSRR